MNKIVNHTSIRFNLGIYECIKIWCVFKLVRTSLLIAYLLRDLWVAIFIVYLSFRRYNSVDFFSTAYPVVFQCRCLCTWHVLNLLLLLCCALIALVSSALMLGDPIAMQIDILKEVQLWDAISSLLSAGSFGQTLLGAVSSTRRLLVYNWINNLLYFTHVFNIVISLSSTSHYY